MGYGGTVFPVNQRYESVSGLKCFPSIGALPRTVDLAYILVNAQQVDGILEEAGESGIPAAIVVASGFAEIGETERQERLRDVSDRFDMLVCGPNCTGVLNFNDSIAASISQVSDIAQRRRVPDEPAVAFVSQSGAFGTTIASLAIAEGIDLCYFISCGNEACLGLPDFLEYLVEQDEVDAIACYIEQLRDGPRFIAACERAWTVGKPIIVVKSGRSEAGSKAVHSHTGSLAGEDSTYDVAFRRGHVIRAEDEGHLVDILRWQGLGRRGAFPRGRRVGIVTMSGGAGALLSDQCAGSGLAVPLLASRTRDAIVPLWPAFASVRNPIDVTGTMVRNAEHLQETLDAVCADENIDNVLLYVNLGHEVVSQITDAVLVAREHGKPIGVIWQQAPAEASAALRGGGIPLFNHTRRAAVSLGTWVAHWADEGEERPSPGGGRRQAGPGSKKDDLELDSVTSEGAALDLLATFGVPIISHEEAKSFAEVQRIAREIGYPCVLKVNSPLVPHRSEMGGVVTGIGNEEELEQAFGAVRHALEEAGLSRVDSYIIEPHVNPLAEVIVGVKRDPTFGHVLIVGMGGIWAELFESVSRVLLPADAKEIERTVLGMRGIETLQGWRGQPRGDVVSLIEATVGVARFAMAHGARLAELDVNPVMVFGEGRGVLAADSLIIWDPARTG